MCCSLFMTSCTPVPNLADSKLILKEDGQPVSAAESYRGFDRSPGSFGSFAHIILDFSASITTSVDAINDALTSFVASVLSSCPSSCYLAISSFAGSASLSIVSDWSNNQQELSERIISFVNPDQDPSTDLNGAIIEGIAKLDALDASQFSTALIDIQRSLIVFTDGRDQASRRSPEDAISATAKASYQSFTIGASSRC